jgi:hypothetical protein
LRIGGFLQFEDRQRQTVDEDNYVGPAVGVRFAAGLLGDA